MTICLIQMIIGEILILDFWIIKKCVYIYIYPARVKKFVRFGGCRF